MMNTRIFVERLNQSLDDVGVPTLLTERIEVLSKWMDVPKFKAETILEGHVCSADDAVLSQLAQELEVSLSWLKGQDEH